MNTNNIYSIRDQVAEDFGPLFEAVNDGVAVRHMVQAMRNVENPSDYQLVHIGEITRENGGCVLLPCGNRVINFTISDDKKFAVIEVTE